VAEATKPDYPKQPKTQNFDLSPTATEPTIAEDFLPDVIGHLRRRLATGAWQIFDVNSYDTFDLNFQNFSRNLFISFLRVETGIFIDFETVATIIRWLQLVSVIGCVRWIPFGTINSINAIRFDMFISKPIRRFSHPCMLFRSVFRTPCSPKREESCE